MKSCFNVFRGLFALFLTVVYWIFITISFLLIPISLTLKDARSLNSALDDIRIEEFIVFWISATPDPEKTTLPAEQQIPQIDLYSLIEDKDIKTELIKTRKEIIMSIYESIEDNEPLYYEIDLEFFNTIYKGIMTEHYKSLPVCNIWPSDLSNIQLDNEEGCLPAPVALSNEIEVPESIEIPSNFQPSENLDFDNVFDYQAAVEQGVSELPIISIDQTTISKLHFYHVIMNYYLIGFILITLTLASLIILIFPGFKTIFILFGLLNMISGIVASIMWLVPSIFVDNLEKAMVNQGFEGIYFQLLEDLVIKISAKGLIASASIGIIGLALVVFGIILPKKKNEEQTE